MRHAEAGETWEWCAWNRNEATWEPVLLLTRLGVSKYTSDNSGILHDWTALDLLTGEVITVYNVPRFGWEKVE